MSITYLRLRILRCESSAETELLFDFSGILADNTRGGSAAERLFMGGSKGIASFFMRGLNLDPPRCIRVLDVNDPPAPEDISILLPFALKLQLVEPRAEFVANLIPFRCVHVLRR